MKGLKISVCGLWILLLCSFFLFSDFQESRGQSVPRSSGSPDIEAFDRAIQHRFLTEPNFGMARMAPTRPEPLRSRHVGSFYAKDEAEISLVTSFAKENWKVGLYLFGRRADPEVRKKGPTGKFKVRYLINSPIAITSNLEAKHLPNAKDLMDEVKSAFISFQSSGGASEDFRFREGDWTYVAKPVRAVNESCITCHTDFVITEKLEKGRFKFRKREVGDVNGVIVYAYSKSEVER